MYILSDSLGKSRGARCIERDVEVVVTRESGRGSEGKAKTGGFRASLICHLKPAKTNERHHPAKE